MATAMLLAGCAQPVDRIPAPPVAAPCDAGKLSGAIGQTYDAQRAEDWRKEAGANAIRVIRSGTIVTMDHRDDRLNVKLDADGRVSAVKCG